MYLQIFEDFLVIFFIDLELNSTGAKKYVLCISPFIFVHTCFRVQRMTYVSE